MSDFRAILHQIRFRLWWPRCGSLQRSPDPLAGFKGPTSKGREGNERAEGGEGRGREKGKGGRAKGKGEGDAYTVQRGLAPLRRATTWSRPKCYRYRQTASYEYSLYPLTGLGHINVNKYCRGKPHRRKGRLPRLQKSHHSCEFHNATETAKNIVEKPQNRDW